MKGLLAIFILLSSISTLLSLCYSIRSIPPKDPAYYTNSSSSSKVSLSNHTSLVLPLFHRTHPKVETLLGPVVELEPLSVAPINKTYTDKYVFYVEFGVGNFYAEFGLDNYPALAIFDTGSFFTWLQTTGEFDPTLSLTYKQLDCENNVCFDVPSNGCSPNGQCRYGITYADGKTSSEGNVGRDTFYFYKAAGKGHDPKSKIRVPMVFGTAIGGEREKVPGVLGVSTHSLGVLSKLKVDQFSVCFPRNPMTESYVTFGTDSITDDFGMPTPMFEDSSHTNFKVMSITIDGSKLTSLGGNGIFIFDSGAETTYLHPDAMRDVVELVIQSLADSEPFPTPTHDYELCYDAMLRSDLRKLNISFELDQEGSLVFDYDHLWVPLGTEICLAFKRSTTYRSILGVKQMQGWRFGFNYRNAQLFIAEDRFC